MWVVESHQQMRSIEGIYVTVLDFVILDPHIITTEPYITII